MTLEYRDQGGGRTEPVGTACPYCEAPIEEGEGFEAHLPCEAVPSADEVER